MPRERRLPTNDDQRFQQVIVRMPPEMYDAVKRRAVDEDRNLSQTIRRAVTQYLAT